MNAPLPRTINDYLAQLRVALQGADPALIQDALYDAEDHLRSEMAENPGIPESDLLAKIAGSYGAPSEVAAIYVNQENQVQQALRPPPPPPRRSAVGRFFGIAADPRAYSALFYMLLALPTGIFYFVWAVTGISLSLGLSILIFGVAFAVLFIATVRVLSLVEGRIIEVMLGERMPRRPLYTNASKPLRSRVAEMFTDPRTWSTLLYMVLRLPLGIVYFTVAIVCVTTSLALVFAPVGIVLGHFGLIDGGLRVDGVEYLPPLVVIPLAFLLGVVLMFATLHLARGVGRLQGALAKHFLVKAAP